MEFPNFVVGKNQMEIQLVFDNQLINKNKYYEKTLINVDARCGASGAVGIGSADAG